MSEVDLTKVRPYGDKLNDGAVQLSFTLPIPCDARAPHAAAAVAKKMGLTEAAVVHSADLGGYTFFVVYGKTDVFIDAEGLAVPTLQVDTWDREKIDEVIEEKIGRELVMIGACIGDDAHTVGIDAIMNMKGFSGHYGLERFRMIRAVNLGSQVPPEKLLSEAIERGADAVLAGQIVTGNDMHRLNLARLIELAEASGVREKALFICGGPRIDHMLALELGFDAGFGRGTFAEHVASFVVQRMLKENVPSP